MDRNGIRRDHLVELEDEFTASAFVTTDEANNQIISFHPGAMDRAHEAKVSSVSEGFNVGIVSPNGRQAMIDNARELKDRGALCVVDPGQGLPILDSAVLVAALEGATVYIVNEYEWELTREKTGLDEDAIAEKVGALVITRGEEGSILRRGGRDAPIRMDVDRIDVAPVKATDVVDPTGCGDAYRAGLLYALTNDLPLAKGARLGSLMGSLKVARRGPQSIELDLDAIRDGYRTEFGESL